jgi:hypothetical protein
MVKSVIRRRIGRGILVAAAAKPIGFATLFISFCRPLALHQLERKEAGYYSAANRESANWSCGRRFCNTSGQVISPCHQPQNRDKSYAICSDIGPHKENW